MYLGKHLNLNVQNCIFTCSEVFCSRFFFMDPLFHSTIIRSHHTTSVLIQFFPRPPAGLVWVVGYTCGGVRGVYHAFRRTSKASSLNIRANAFMNGFLRQGGPLSTTLATIGKYVCKRMLINKLLVY